MNLYEQRPVCTHCGFTSGVHVCGKCLYSSTDYKNHRCSKCLQIMMFTIADLFIAIDVTRFIHACGRIEKTDAPL
jgi:hypothetical protein